MTYQITYVSSWSYAAVLDGGPVKAVIRTVEVEADTEQEAIRKWGGGSSAFRSCRPKPEGP